LLLLVIFIGSSSALADHLYDLQKNAELAELAAWGHWGTNPEQYSQWTTHSNRLVPIYTFGIELDWCRDASPYHDREKLESLYGFLPENCENAEAGYLDQTVVHRLQRKAIADEKK